jgi:hypothetical protein
MFVLDSNAVHLTPAECWKVTASPIGFIHQEGYLNREYGSISVHGRGSV